MRSLKRHEGYLLIDNRSGPGISQEQLAKLPRKGATLAVSEGRKVECGFYICHHCHVTVILNPERSRERPYCRKCDHRICDRCHDIAWRTGECRPMKAVLDTLQEQTLLREQAGLPPGEILISK